MATDAQTLLAQANCYACNAVSGYDARLMQLALLQQMVLSLNPMADTSPQTLLSQANCYACFGANAFNLQLMELALLAQISTALGGGGGGGVDINQVLAYTGTDPNADGIKPGNLLDGAIAYKKDGTGPIYGWNIALQTWN